VNNKYSREKTSRIQVKFKEDEDLHRKDSIDALAKSKSVSVSALIIEELEAIIRESKQ
jgi:hypothetical protein